jgi:hypothetical protein
LRCSYSQHRVGRFAFKYYPNEKLDFELHVPFLRTSNTTTVIANGMHGRGGGTQRSVQSSESQMGLGDVSLTTGYNLIEQWGRLAGNMCWKCTCKYT